jgi:hypothetical protein
MPDRWTRLLAPLVALALLGGVAAPDVIRVGAFASQDPDRARPADWRFLAFEDLDTKTQYDLVRADSGTVVQARSDGGAGGLGTERRIDLKEYPILEWRWRVEGVVEGGNARTEEGDDYAARIYVTFDYDDLGFTDTIKLNALRALGYDQIPARALNYIWANQVAQGIILETAFTDWVMMVTVKSGPEATGRWHTERRNVLADYRAAFGEDPPPVNGVAIMTDTDNTGGAATAYYGDIVFRSDTAATSAR